MDYEFTLSRPIPDRILHNLSVNPTTDQKTFASRITDLTLGLLVDALIITDQTELLVADAPFHLFAVSDYLCDLLGLEHGCVVMLNLTQDLPHIEWHDNDIGTLQRKAVSDLQAIIATLKCYKATPAVFTRLTSAV